MENLIRLLEQGEDFIEQTNFIHTHSSIAPGSYIKLKQAFTKIISSLFGPNLLLWWRGHQFSFQLMKAERESILPLQDKIILLSRAITMCYERFDFAPTSLEITLAKKTEELNRSLLKQLAP